MDDAALVEAARGGDQAAFAAIYDRYADRLHDFCHSVLRDRHEAADAMQDTFLVASRRLAQLREPSKLRAWLFAIARHESLRRARAAARTDGGEVPDMASADPGPVEVAASGEAREVVWAAADGLAPRDRVILDLHLRQNLDGQELADALGVSVSHGYVLLSRVRDQVERSLGALLLARFGRSDCPELAQLLGRWDGKITPLLRKRIARHADSCATCETGRKESLNPLALLGAVPLVPAPAHAREAVLDGFRLIASSEDAPQAQSDGWTAQGFPPPLDPPRRRHLPLGAVAATIVLLAALLSWQPWGPTANDAANVAAGGTPNGPTSTTAGGDPTTPVPTAPGGAPGGATSALTPSSETPNPLGSSVPVTTVPVSTTVDSGIDPVIPTTLPPTTSSTTTTLVVARPDGQAPVIGPPSSRATLLRARPCAPATTTVGATVTDDSGLAGVVLRWRAPNGSLGSASMTAGGGTFYTGTLGPFAASLGNGAQWWVEATDDAGNVSRSATMSLPVDPCSSAG